MNAKRNICSKFILSVPLLTLCLVGQALSQQFFTDLSVGNREGVHSAMSASDRLYVYHSDTGAGVSGIYSYRQGIGTPTGGGGRSWTPSGVDAAIKGYSFWGNVFSAGVAAYSYLDYPNSTALVAADAFANNVAYLVYNDPLSGGCVWSARLTGSIVMGPQVAGQRWIIYSDNRQFTIAPDLGTNFDWSKNFTINKNGGQAGIGVAPADNSTNRLQVAGNTQVDGSLGIGVTPSSANKLSVNGNGSINGTLNVKELDVLTTVPWPDFVFKKGAKIESLSETEKFIRANSHLPGIPSQREVRQKGINIARVQAKTLERLEILTMQLIEQNKELVRLTQENNALRERVVNLEQSKMARQ